MEETKHYTAATLMELARQLTGYAGQFVELSKSMQLNEIESLPERSADQLRRAKGTFRAFIAEIEDAITETTAAVKVAEDAARRARSKSAKR